MGGDPRASRFAPSFPAMAGLPGGAETDCAAGFPAVRHPESLEVRTSTFQSDGVLPVCHIRTMLSDADKFGELPICRYGFSRNCVSGSASPSSIALVRTDANANEMCFNIVFPS